MSLNEWRNKELNTLMMKKWGLLKEGEKPAGGKDPEAFTGTEEEEKKEKRPNMGFYDVGSASAGFRPGEIEHDPDRLFAGQVSGKIGRDHPLERALFGR